MQDDDRTDRHRVVVIGSGFGGLFATRALRRADVDITLVDRTPTHLFQPLLYQVATGILSPGEIAPSTREILRRQRNVHPILGEVIDIDLARRTVTSAILEQTTVTPYDSLVVAAGAGQSYFGNDHFARYAPGMKSIDDALELRGRIFGAFEMAELETDPAALDAWLTFIVVGAGPTGVEMAGQIVELSRRALSGNFRHIDTRTVRVILVDAAPAVLGAFGEKLSGQALRELQRIGVEVQLSQKVVGVDPTGIEVEGRDGARTYLPAMTKIWAAGVAASPLGALLAEQSGASVDRAGRVEVGDDLTLPGHPEVFVVGDMSGRPGLPGVAQVALQGGRYAAAQIQRDAKGRPRSDKPFTYFDKGSMATISRFRAVASVGRFRLSGFVAWLMWLVVHLVYLIGFKNRITTLLHWLVSFVGRGRAERVFTLQQVVGRLALQDEQGGSTPDGQLARRAGIDRSRLTSISVPGDGRHPDDAETAAVGRSGAAERSAGPGQRGTPPG